MGEETTDYDPLATNGEYADDDTPPQPIAATNASGGSAGDSADGPADGENPTPKGRGRAKARNADAVDSPRPSMAKPDLPELPELRDTFDPDAPLIDSSDRSRDEFTTVYDIIDGMETALADAKPVLFSPGSVRIDRDALAEQLEQLKKMLPVQLERASALMRESERRLESAQTQANAIVASAQSRAANMVREANEQAQFLAGQENVTEIARQKARAILDQAQTKADSLTRNADKYCITIMETLQQQLDKFDNGVQAGLKVLYDRQNEAGAHLQHIDADDYPKN